MSSKDRVLDVGAGTCNVAEVLKERGFDVTPLDIVDLSFVDGLKARLYEGGQLPFEEKAFDVALVLTVLHHTRDPEKLLGEVCRVARRAVVIEDIHQNKLHRLLTCLADSLLNLEFVGHPHSNKSDSEWRELFQRMELSVKDSGYTGLGVLRSATYYLEA